MRPTLGLLTAAVMLSGSAVAARLDSAAAPVSRRGLATLASAALPGTGQLLLGTRVRGEVMLWTDAALWSLWGGSTWLGASRERDARLVASAKAGADLGQTDRRYYRALERYDNSDEYNEDVRREARARYPDDPDAQRRYYEANSYSGEAAWDWVSDSVRINDYWETRKAGRTAALTAGFTVGALLLNRLVSLVDCAFFARDPAQERRVEAGPSLRSAGLELRYRF